MNLLLTGMLAAIVISGCNSEAAVNKQTTTEMKHDHTATYACPMHPEVTGKKGATCPKCGMKLEQITTDDRTVYFLKFAASTNIVVPNKELTLSFTPKRKGKNDEQVILEVQHERKMHLIIVSEDLSYFSHIHPEMNAVGEYLVNTSFPHAGKFYLFADYKPEGSSQVVDRLEMYVTGSAPKSQIYTIEKLIGSSGPYSFTLKPVAKALVAGGANHILGVIERDGRQIDVNTLENYLGAKAHVVIIDANDKTFLHVHPTVSNGMLGIHADFNKPGIYRGWIQFKDKFQLHTIDVTFKVEEGNESSHTHSDPHVMGHKH